MEDQRAKGARILVATNALVCVDTAAVGGNLFVRMLVQKSLIKGAVSMMGYAAAVACFGMSVGLSKDGVQDGVVLRKGVSDAPPVQVKEEGGAVVAGGEVGKR